MTVQPQGSLHQTAAKRRVILDDLSDASFEQIAALAHEWAGLVMQSSKKNMVKSRLIRRLRALGMTSFEEYCDFVRGVDGLPERQHLIGALTTNVSQFFRESHHFETLRRAVLPPLLARLKTGEKLRIWSAGCSNGQEPYSIAMTLHDMDPAITQRDVRILATDIDQEVIAFAKAGRYPAQMMTGMPENLRARHFTTCPDDPDMNVFGASLRSMITFNMLNLHDAWPMKSSFDIIFCRNVLIYFDDPTQERVIARFRNQLGTDGWLFLGHSERVPNSLVNGFTNEGVTTLRKTGRA